MAIKKRKHPQFLRPNYGRKSRSRIKKAWRRPRGIDNKKRLKIKYMGASPSIGYRQPNEIRYHHPKGLPEALVQTPSDLEGLKNVVLRIAGGVGSLKREAIQKLAAAKGLHVLNPKKFVPKAKKPKKEEKKQQPAAQAKPSAVGGQPSKSPAQAAAAAPAADKKD